MVRQGWLHPLRLACGPGYLLTPKAARRLDEAATRIYRTRDNSWDGRFDLVVIDPPAQRTDRGRLASNLSFLGYGAIDAATWVAARPTDEIETLLDETGIRFERFTASHSGGVDGAIALVRRAWNLTEIGAAYEEFVRELSPVVSSIGTHSDDEAAYAARFALVHAWRTFLFRDPQLPPALLPEQWPGSAAADFFDAHAARLRPAADRFVDRSLPLAPSRLPMAAS
jgi:phenylacetic acid degradation operon negative regulatory protein